MNDMEDLPLDEKNPQFDAEVEEKDALPPLNDEVVQFDIDDFSQVLQVF